MQKQNALTKPKRVENPDLIEFVKTLPCIACGVSGPSDAHHVTHKGAGGGDEARNLMSLCRIHHTEWHKVGPKKFCESYPSVKDWLKRAGRKDVLERMRR